MSQRSGGLGGKRGCGAPLDTPREANRRGGETWAGATERRDDIGVCDAGRPLRGESVMLRADMPCEETGATDVRCPVCPPVFRFIHQGEGPGLPRSSVRLRTRIWCAGARCPGCRGPRARGVRGRAPLLPVPGRGTALVLAADRGVACRHGGLSRASRRAARAVEVVRHVWRADGGRRAAACHRRVRPHRVGERPKRAPRPRVRAPRGAALGRALSSRLVGGRSSNSPARRRGPVAVWTCRVGVGRCQRSVMSRFGSS
jgi:hypothetical protein